MINQPRRTYSRCANPDRFEECPAFLYSIHRGKLECIKGIISLDKEKQLGVVFYTEDPIKIGSYQVDEREGILWNRIRRRGAEPGDGTERIAVLKCAVGYGFLADVNPLHTKFNELWSNRDRRDDRIQIKRRALDNLNTAQFDFALKGHVNVQIILVVVAKRAGLDHFERRR